MTRYIVTDDPSLLRSLGRSTERPDDLVVLDLAAAASVTLQADGHAYVDIDLLDHHKVTLVRRLLRALDGSSRRVFACDHKVRNQVVQANALGATRLVGRPLPLSVILDLLSDEPKAAPSPVPEPPDDAETVSQQTASRSAVVLGRGMDALLKDGPFDTPSFRVAAAGIAGSVDEKRLGTWLGVVKTHHEGTYRHVLLVAGVMAQFARSLNLSPESCAKLTLAALVHDVGKARIPTQILDKPTHLTPEERVIVERHPQEGYDFLTRKTDLPEDVLFAVLHHHEMLDGSGYPKGLRGREIPTKTRMLTICDIFGALIENRGYRLGLKPDKAFAHLQGMVEGGKLDGKLVAAFARVAACAGEPGRTSP